MMTEQEAIQQVRELKKFYGNLTSYCITIPFLAGLNFFTSPGHWWFVYPMLGWGFGLLGHASKVFPLFRRSRDWEERKMRELMHESEDFVSTSKLNNILDEKIGNARKSPNSNDPVIKKLIQRIEHLEAIVTTKDWEKVETFADRKPEVIMPNDSEPEENLSTEEKVSRIARKVL